MKLAPPRGSLPIAATYGNTRRDNEGNSKLHNGVDLYAPVGTPIYSMFSGTIGKTVSEQVNKVYGGVNANKDTVWVYPNDYVGDDNGAGNRVYVNSVVDGINISIGYWHLQSSGVGDGPIAINPRTGVPFKTGDQVFQGEIVGYAGYTGNASKSVPHLHLNMLKNGEKQNPANYLNAVVSTTEVEIVLLNCFNAVSH